MTGLGGEEGMEGRRGRERACMRDEERRETGEEAR